MLRHVVVNYGASVSLIMMFPAIDQACPRLEREVKVGVVTTML